MADRQLLKAALENKDAIFYESEQKRLDLEKLLKDTIEQLEKANESGRMAELKVEEMKRECAELKHKCDEFYWQATGLLIQQQEYADEINSLQLLSTDLVSKTERQYNSEKYSLEKFATNSHKISQLSGLQNQIKISKSLSAYWMFFTFLVEQTYTRHLLFVIILLAFNGSFDFLHFVLAFNGSFRLPALVLLLCLLSEDCTQYSLYKKYNNSGF